MLSLRQIRWVLPLWFGLSNGWTSPVAPLVPTSRLVNPRRHSTPTTCLFSKKKAPFAWLTDPFQTNIPEERQAEIYAIEDSRPEVEDRLRRVGVYVAIGVIGVSMAFFNGLLTDMRAASPEGEFDFEAAGFAWVQGNFLSRALFLNKLGGAVSLLGGAAVLLLAETEMDKRRLGAEKIYEDMLEREKRKKKRRRGTELPVVDATVESTNHWGEFDPVDLFGKFCDKTESFVVSQANTMKKGWEQMGFFKGFQAE